MDAQHIVIALQHIFNPQEALRKQAEAHLKQWETVPGFMVALLQVVASHEIDLSIRQAGASHFKNLTKQWRQYVSEDDDPSASTSDAASKLNFPEQDRTVIKENIIDALIHSPPAVQVQLATAISKIAGHDFPEKWDSFIPKITALIHSQNPSIMHAALLALLMGIGKYSRITGDKTRKSLHAIVTNIFPLLANVFSHLLNVDSLESANMQRLICKIFYFCNYNRVSPYMIQPDALNQWMTLLRHMLEKPVSEALQSKDPEDRAKFPMWSAKKWAARILERFIRKYTKPKQIEKKIVHKFAALWNPVHVVGAMETFLRVLAVKRGGGGYLPEKFAQAVLCYLRLCIRFGVTFVPMKQHLNILLREILFPFLCVTDADIELWQEDPVEYLRKEFDPIAEFHNPRSECINFICDLVMFRGKHYLNSIMSFIVELLKKYSAAPEATRNHREKDGCLHTIGSLSPWLYRMPEYSNNLEAMLVAHVFSELSSPYGFLRARSCWIFSQFRKVKFSNAANFSGAVKKVLSMMEDPDLPVRVNAGVSLRFVLSAKNVEEVLRPLLPHILEAIFKLMGEIDSEELVATLEAIIAKFGTEMAPYAVALVHRLTEAFMKFYKNADESEEADNSHSAAYECLMALKTVLSGVKTMPEIYAKINPIILPMFMDTLNENSIDFFENLLLLLTFCTFYGDVSTMWPTFQLMFSAYDLWASDYIQDMIPPIDNFISRAPDAFLNGPYLDMVMRMYKKATGDLQTGEDEAEMGTELVESVMHNCRGKVDHVLSDIITVAVHRLNSVTASEDAADFKVSLIEVIANALYYNPLLTLQILEAKALTATVFTQWFALVPHIQRPFDIKLVVLGLSAIFEIPLASLPDMIQKGSKMILEALVKLLQKSAELRKEKADRKLDREHEDAVAKKEAEEKARQQGNGVVEEDEDDSDEEVEMHDFPDADDVDAIDSDDDELEMSMLGADAEAIIKGDHLGDANDNDDEAIVDGDEIEDDGEEYEDEELDDDDYDDDDDDDEEYVTVIDRVDELVYFASRMIATHNNSGANFNALVSSMSPEQQKALNDLVESAKQREVENAQKEKERLSKLMAKSAGGS